MAIKSVVASPIDASLAPDCSICLEKVVDDNSQAIAKLKCGHLFHMSCVGCLFNIRGLMKCPNCRAIENSDWLFCFGDPEIDLLYDTDDEMDSDDASLNQNQSQNLPQCPYGVFCPCPQHGHHGQLPAVRPTNALHVGGNIRNVVYPDHAQTPHHSFLGPIFPPLAPQSMPFHASNATMSIGLASSILNHRPPVTLRPNGYAPYPLLSFGVHHGSSPATSFSSPNVAARSHILYGRAPPPSSTQAPLARTEAHWAPPCDLNLIRIGPLLHQGGLTRRRANNNAVHDPLALTLATGTFMAAAHPRMIN